MFDVQERSTLVGVSAWPPLAGILLLSALSPGALAGPLEGRVSKDTFDPTIGQTVGIEVRSETAGRATVSVVDRDGVAVRTFRDVAVAAGENRFTWDGKDEKGLVVPDEVYTPRVVLRAGGRTATSDPAAGFVPKTAELRLDGFSRETGTLSYTLPWPARVHIQAGQAVLDEKTKQARGPVLKTIADRAPRVAGRVVESWNGFDESGLVYVPDLPKFVVGVFATSLPEGAVIATGNRREGFVAYVERTRPKARPRKMLDHAAHAHHLGLTAVEDRSPSVSIQPNGTWDAAARSWRVKSPVRLAVALGPEAAPFFTGAGAGLYLFRGADEIAARKAPTRATSLSFGANDLPPGEHVVAVNWVSGVGPVGVGTVRLLVEGAPVREARR